MESGFRIKFANAAAQQLDSAAGSVTWLGLAWIVLDLYQHNFCGTQVVHVDVDSLSLLYQQVDPFI